MIKLNNFTVYLYYFFVFVIIILINIFQIYDQHWMEIPDSDFNIIYNSLIMGSGYNQETWDHPGFFNYFILSLTIKFISLISNFNYNIDTILGSEKIDLYFQNVFYTARILQIIYAISIIAIFHLILKRFNFENKIIIPSNIILVSSTFFWQTIFDIRPELISILFFLISIIIYLNFLDTKKRILLIFLGIVLSCLLLTKVQNMLLLPIYFFLYFIYFQRKKLDNFNLGYNYLERVISFLSIIAFILLFSYISYKNYTYLETYFVFLDFAVIISIFIFLLLLTDLRKENNFIKYFLPSLFYVGCGFVLSILFFIIFDRLNIVKFHFFANFSVISNPFYHMYFFSSFTEHLHFSFDSLITIYKTNYPLQYISFVFVIFIFFFNKIKKNKFLAFFNFVCIAFVLYCLFLNFLFVIKRPVSLYGFYSFVPMAFLFSLILNSFSKKTVYLIFSCFVLINISLFDKNFFINKFNYTKTPNKWICDHYLGLDQYIYLFHSKMTPEHLRIICKIDVD